MAKTKGIDFSYKDYEMYYSHEIERKDEFDKIARKLSNFIKKLDLSPEENEKLTGLIVDIVHCAEQGGFQYCFKLGLKGKYNPM